MYIHTVYLMYVYTYIDLLELQHLFLLGNSVNTLHMVDGRAKGKQRKKKTILVRKFIFFFPKIGI